MPIKKGIKLKLFTKIIILIIFLLPIILTIFNNKFLQEDHNKSEGSQVSIKSNDSNTNVYLDSQPGDLPVSQTSANHNEAFSRGDFIVWVEESQNKSQKSIVRYHVPSKTTIYITTDGIAEHPKVSTQGGVVWQEWQNDRWQVFYFDGFQTEQISTKNTSCINPDIAENKIVYATKDMKNNWQTIQFSIENKQEEIINNGIRAKTPYFYGTKLFFR